jgi:hypothetical protein
LLNDSIRDSLASFLESFSNRAPFWNRKWNRLLQAAPLRQIMENEIPNLKGFSELYVFYTLIGTYCMENHTVWRTRNEEERPASNEILHREDTLQTDPLTCAIPERDRYRHALAAVPTGRDESGGGGDAVGGGGGGRGAAVVVPTIGVPPGG